MGGQLEPRLSWNVRTDAKRADPRPENLKSLQQPVTLNELASVQQFVAELCKERFPGRDGYVRGQAKLSGPIEGITMTISRGDFRALVSVQQYTRELGERWTCGELRLIACAGSQRIADGERIAESVAHRTLLTGTAVAALVAFGMAWGVGAAIAGIAHWMTPFAGHGPLLALPSVLTGLLLSTGASSWGRSRGRRVLGVAHVAANKDHDLQSDMRRWIEVLHILRAHYELIAQQAEVRPFRRAAGCRWSPADASAIAPHRETTQ